MKTGLGPFVTAASLFLLALLLRLIVVRWWDFDGLYGQDPFAYYQQAVAISQTLHGGLAPPGFFWPNGYPLLSALFMAVLGQTPTAAQWASVVTGAALAPLGYALALSLFPPAGQVSGIVAGLAIAVAGQPLLSSVVVMADIPGLFWMSLALLVLIQATRRRHPALWLFSAGSCFGLAVVTRWAYALVAPAFAAYLIRQIRMRRLSARHAVIAVVWDC
ncbi:MAG: hypothetical protein GY759_19655 [Chloroflexi bacterium]|nr:hypothetical protein [Chloroflexota bacterium]